MPLKDPIQRKAYNQRRWQLIKDQERERTRLYRQTHAEQLSAYAREKYIKRKADQPAVPAVVIVEKACSSCGLTKPVAEFYKRRASRDGYHPHCIECDRTKKRLYNIRTAVDHRAKSKAWREANPERTKVLRMRHHFKKRYGITLDDYERMYADQKGQCALCQRDGGSWSKPDALNVDHDHASGAVRGLLCTACNVGLGLLGDSPERLRLALVYLGA